MQIVQECPIKADVEEAGEVGEQFVTVIQKLRRDLDACESCRAYEDCPILGSLNSMINDIIEEVNDEWTLTI